MRRFALHEIEERIFDVAIIGGGVTGAAAAREAALRGLSVALVEKGELPDIIENDQGVFVPAAFVDLFGNAVRAESLRAENGTELIVDGKQE